MNVSKPFEAMFPAVDSDVLAVVARSSRPRTGREVARLAGRSQPAVQTVLDRLTEQGLVYASPAGRSRTYTLNRDHLAAPPIEALANLRPQLFDRLRKLIATWPIRPVHASVFGSAARGDGTSESDIDVFIVRPRGRGEDDPAWEKQIDELGDRIFAWTGNHAGIAEVGEQSLATSRKDKLPVLAEIKSDAVELGGKSVQELLGAT